MTTFLELVTQEIGVPYVYGGDSPAGFDCSGLVQWAAAKVGVELPRGATDQMHKLDNLAVPAANTVAGDLVFFNTGDGWEAGHVGVCANTGCTEMIDAPHTGALVRREAVQGFATVVGYRQLPGDASGAHNLPGAGLDILPGQALDAAGNLDPLQAVLDALGSLPGKVLEVLLGGHTPAELALRGVEIVGGALVFAAGAVTVLLVIAEHGGQPERATRGARRAARTVDRGGRGAVGRVRQATTPERAPRGRTRTDRRRLDVLLGAERGAGNTATKAGELRG